MDFYALADTNIDPDGFHDSSVDGYGEGDASSTPYESHHLHGFISRPMAGAIDQASGEVDSANASQVFILNYGHRAHAFNCEDPRTVPILPAIQRGESLMYGSAWGQFVRCHKDGSISLVTTSKSAYDGTGQPLHFWLRPTGLEFVAPWGRLVFDQTGFHVSHISGASMGLGSLSGFPPPLNAIASHFSVQAGIVSHDATAVAAGPSVGVQQPVALAPTTLATFSAVSDALVQVATAINLIGGALSPLTATPAGGPVIAPPAWAEGALGAIAGAVALANSGVAAATVAIATASETIPSASLAG